MFGQSLWSGIFPFGSFLRRLGQGGNEGSGVGHNGCGAGVCRRTRAGLVLHAGVLAVLALLLAACAPASFVVLLDSPDGSAGEVVVRSADGQEVALSETGGALALGAGGARPVTISAAQMERHFADTQAVQPLRPEVFLLYFQTGGTALTAESIALMPAVLQTVRERPAPDVSVIGHTDTLGSADLNERLALERAEYVAAWLASANPKVLEITVASHGQRNLLIPTADQVSEPRNRRVEITVR